MKSCQNCGKPASSPDGVLAAGDRQRYHFTSGIAAATLSAAARACSSFEWL